MDEARSARRASLTISGVIKLIKIIKRIYFFKYSTYLGVYSTHQKNNTYSLKFSTFSWHHRAQELLKLFFDRSPMREITIPPVAICLLPGFGRSTIFISFFPSRSSFHLFLELPLHLLKHLGFVKSECSFLSLTGYFLFYGFTFFVSALL